jgi:hypothetical protein
MHQKLEEMGLATNVLCPTARDSTVCGLEDPTTKTSKRI